jgi:hypothetical protein
MNNRSFLIRQLFNDLPASLLDHPKNRFKLAVVVIRVGNYFIAQQKLHLFNIFPIARHGQNIAEAIFFRFRRVSQRGPCGRSFLPCLQSRRVAVRQHGPKDSLLWSNNK